MCVSLSSETSYVWEKDNVWMCVGGCLRERESKSTTHPCQSWNPLSPSRNQIILSKFIKTVPNNSTPTKLDQSFKKRHTLPKWQTGSAYWRPTVSILTRISLTNISSSSIPTTHGLCHTNTSDIPTDNEWVSRGLLFKPNSPSPFSSLLERCKC